MLAFARGRPGFGLLMHRIIAALLIFTMITHQFLARGVGLGAFLLSIVALFIVLGPFTVISSGIAALLTVILFWFLRDSPILVVATSATLCVSFSMLGAGAYSLDALLFGRRRVIFPNS
jgi:hypothetical protein